MYEDYDDLKEAVEAAGFFTTFQPIRQPGDRIICASRSSPRGLSGNSFWVARRGGEWYVATWSPLIYRLPDASRLVELCLLLLRRKPTGPFGAYAEFDEGVCAQFGLVRIADDEFVD
jgi:hypothetical protein